MINTRTQFCLMTSLKANLCQDLNWGFAFSRVCDGTISWRNFLFLLRREVFCLLSFPFFVWCTNVIPKMTCFIKAHAKWRNSIAGDWRCYQRSTLKMIRPQILISTVTSCFPMAVFVATPETSTSDKEAAYQQSWQ